MNLPTLRRPSFSGSLGSGALVISLDLELHWGVRDLPYKQSRSRLSGTREAGVRILDLFEKYEISATWAVVGLLFAESREEMQEFLPIDRPTYANRTLDPYVEPVGRDEREDPIHFASSLIRKIITCPRQEIGSHTFSHYYCLEPGQTVSQFRADLNSAVRIAARQGILIESLVLPRNQIAPEYLACLGEYGIKCYRGVGPNWLQRPRARSSQRSALKRIGRLADTYLNLTGDNLVAWPSEPTTPVNIAASRYLRPYSRALSGFQELQLARIYAGLRAAAVQNELFHLWWHPEDFGDSCGENISFLRRVLEAYRVCRDEFGMSSCSMGEAASRVCSAVPAAAGVA